MITGILNILNASIVSLGITVTPNMVDVYSETYDIHKNELTCLAKNIYFESRGEVMLGQEAVARVSLNRVDDSNYPNSICKVVYQCNKNKVCQFSWVSNKNKTPSNNAEWQKAMYVAMLSHYKYINNEPDPTDGATMFHSTTVKPYWRKSYDKTVKIGNHVFYR